MLEPHPVVQRELRAETPVVLHVSAVVMREDVERRRHRELTLACRIRRRIPEQERGEGVPIERVADSAVRRGHVAVELEAACALAWNERIDANLSIVRSELE